MIIGHHNILIFDVRAIGKLSFFIAESSAMFGYLHFWLWINYLPTLVGFFQKEKCRKEETLLSTKLARSQTVLYIIHLKCSV